MEEIKRSIKIPEKKRRGQSLSLHPPNQKGLLQRLSKRWLWCLFWKVMTKALKRPLILSHG